MIDEVKRIIDQYFVWLRDNTTLRTVSSDWVEISTPHLDRHNDFLQIYAKKTNDGFLLCDDGYIIEDLLNSGCKLDTPKRQELLRITLAGFGVTNNDGVLEVHTSPNNFAIRKHNLLQAMLSVNDLFYLSSSVVSSLFYEDVVSWLDLSNIRYVPKMKLKGKSGLDHLFDFVIPKSQTYPVRIIQTINNPNADSAKLASFKWIDTKDVRSSGSKAYVVINDNNKRVGADVIDALNNYDMSPVLWSMRDSYSKELVA